MKKPARDAGAVNAKIKASVQDTRQGTVNAKITSPRGHGDTGTRGRFYCLLSLDKKDRTQYDVIG